MKQIQNLALIFVVMLMAKSVNSQQVMSKPAASEEVVFTVVEEMPRFPGCETMKGDHAEIKKCSGEKLFQYIFANLKYPEEAKKNGVQGTVIAKFVVKKDGGIGDVSLLRDPGSGLGNAAIQVLKSMNTMSEKWIPGRQRGNAVNVYFTLPIKFDLGIDDKK